MENAGRAITQILFEKFPLAGQENEVFILAGKGNNAGDSFVVARHLLGLGLKVRVCHLARAETYTGTTKINFELLKKFDAKIDFINLAKSLSRTIKAQNSKIIIIDGLLGTGLVGELRRNYQEVVNVINKRDNIMAVISIDIPSGINGDTGNEHGGAIKADITVSFGFPKLGHFLSEGSKKRGSLVNVDISFPSAFRLEGDKYLITKGIASDLLKDRDINGHKNSFGHTLLVGGTPGRLGAILMATKACLNTGVGLVTVATGASGYQALLKKLPSEAMAKPISLVGKEFKNFIGELCEYSAIVVGPGLGITDENKGLLENILSSFKGPIILDADALNVISKYNLHNKLKKRRFTTILTPHIGEMARLIGKDKDSLPADPIASVQNIHSQTNAIIVLKGAATFIAFKHNDKLKIYLHHFPNNGMAKGGSGDVLAGMLGGLLAQEYSGVDASVLGVYLHSLAGEIAAQKYGTRSMTATNIIGNIGNAFKKLKKPCQKTFPVEGRIWLR